MLAVAEATKVACTNKPSLTHGLHQKTQGGGLDCSAFSPSLSLCALPFLSPLSPTAPIVPADASLLVASLTWLAPQRFISAQRFL